MSENFEKAIRAKVRFETTKGVITLEDLYDLSIPSLETMAQKLNKEKKELEGESFFVTKQTKESRLVDLKLELVIHVGKTKIAEKEKHELRQIKLSKAAELRDLIQKKERTVLESKNMEDLQKELAELEGEII